MATIDKDTIFFMTFLDDMGGRRDFLILIMLEDISNEGGAGGVQLEVDSTSQIFYFTRFSTFYDLFWPNSTSTFTLTFQPLEVGGYIIGSIITEFPGF